MAETVASDQVVSKMSSRQDFPEIEIGYSSENLLLMTGAGMVMTLLSAAVVFNWYHDKHIGMFKIAVGYLGIPFFGLATCGAAWRLVTWRGPVVFISREGIRDLRISRELISWKSVEAISFWQYRGRKSMVLKVEPSIAKRLNASSVRRFFFQLNKTLGIDGVIVGSGGLAVNVDAMIETCREYRDAAAASHAGASISS